MIRYRCPYCAALIAAHERRIGQSSVCKACVKPHQIPSDQSLWLDEAGAQLHPPTPTVFAAPTVTESQLEPIVPPVTAPALELSSESATPAAIRELQGATPIDALLPEPIVVSSSSASIPLPAPGQQSDLIAPAPGWATASSAAKQTESNETVEQTSPQPVSFTVATLTPPPSQSPAFSSPMPVATAAPQAIHRRWQKPTPQTNADGASEEHDEPVQLQTQADIAVALTAALTSRMKPPPAPRRDLRPSTAAWMLLTGISIVLILVALFGDVGQQWTLSAIVALGLGAAQIVAGYVWIVHLTHLRDPQRGLLCAIPPLTFIYLVQYKYAKLRPLRFVLTGTCITLLAASTSRLAPHTQSFMKEDDSPHVVSPDPAVMSKLEQLRYYRDRQAYAPLDNLLELLAKTDPLLSEDAKDRTALSAELKQLCRHSDTNVKIQAMAAYARWDPDNARAVCLAAIHSGNYQEREKALQLLPQWKDSESARAAQSLIGRPGTVETNRAKAALEKIGGRPAEEAAIVLLNRADDQATKLTAFSILKKVGSADTAKFLRNYAMAADPAVRAESLAAAAEIEVRLRVSNP